MDTPIMDISTQLRLRLDEATTSSNKWNSWPDKLAIVKQQRILLLDISPIEAFGLGVNYGFAAGRYSCYRQIFPRTIPFTVGYPNNAPTPQVHFGYAQEKGQDDDILLRNILATWRWTDWGHKSPGGRPEWLFLVELGCEHDYDDAGSNHIRGYHRGRCKKCGHTFVCDSGD